MNSIVKTSFFLLWLLAKVKPYLSKIDLEQVTGSFIATQSDNCHSLYAGLDQSFLGRLQLVPNAVTQLLTGSRKKGILPRYWHHFNGFPSILE